MDLPGELFVHVCKSVHISFCVIKSTTPHARLLVTFELIESMQHGCGRITFIIITIIKTKKIETGVSMCICSMDVYLVYLNAMHAYEIYGGIFAERDIYP